MGSLICIQVLLQQISLFLLVQQRLTQRSFFLLIGLQLLAKLLDFFVFSYKEAIIEILIFHSLDNFIVLSFVGLFCLGFGSGQFGPKIENL